MSGDSLPRQFDVVVIGAGAAGLMCAIEAGKRGRSVCLLEHNERVGKKILISGGGRCNFTNTDTGPHNFLSTHPDFCRSALARFTPHDFIGLVEEHGIAYHEKKLGQQFCDTSSKAIVAMLLEEGAKVGVEIVVNCRVTRITKPLRFNVTSSQGTFASTSLVIATGGLSFANLGATGFGYEVASQFDVRVTERRPGLVPLTFSPADRHVFSRLSGISLPVVVSTRGTQFAENLLVTHRGWSGPAILQISSYWREGETVDIDLLPGQNAAAWLKTNREKTRKLPELLSELLPKRFAEAWSGRFGPESKHQPSDAELEDTGRRLKQWQVKFGGTEGYGKAEVTVGGVDTRELSSKTMEARKVPGLFFIGEVVDVTGWLGGYNFQWAWASGWAAGQVV